MTAVKERIAVYRTYALQFAKRLSDFLETFFKIQVGPIETAYSLE